ncbi:MAG: hypothetical protein EON93_20585, partial [Burkholderiales bacterium]
MRFPLCLAALVAAVIQPAFAQGWAAYENGRFGYETAIPPGFSGQGESDNGDGQTFDKPGTTQTLAAWGANMLEESFEAEVEASMGYAQSEGFNISFQTVTPEWATFSGIAGDRQFIRRIILLCDRQSTASISLQFSSRDAADIK